MKSTEYLHNEGKGFIMEKLETACNLHLLYRAQAEGFYNQKDKKERYGEQKAS